MIEKAINKITSHQPNERNHQWMVGEQLKDFCRANPHDADLIFHDLDIPELSLANAEKKLEAFAKKNNMMVMPQEAEDILRKFYHLTPRNEAYAMSPYQKEYIPSPEQRNLCASNGNLEPGQVFSIPPATEKKQAVNVSLDDFL